MNRWISSLLACALLALLVWPAALGAQDKFKKPAASDDLAVLKKPIITDVHHNIYGDPPPEMDMTGANFGATRGTKKVSLDGTLVTNYLFWGNNSIVFYLPFRIIYWDHVYQWAIVSGPTVLSNVLSQRIPYDFDGMAPREGPVGTKVWIDVYRLPASPGGLVLKIGTMDFTVISWTGGNGRGFGKITARVPPGVPFGENLVYLQKGGEVASEKYRFRVILPLVAPPPKVKIK